MPTDSTASERERVSELVITDIVDTRLNGTSRECHPADVTFFFLQIATLLFVVLCARLFITFFFIIVCSISFFFFSHILNASKVKQKCQPYIYALLSLCSKCREYQSWAFFFQSPSSVDLFALLLCAVFRSASEHVEYRILHNNSKR